MATTLLCMHACSERLYANVISTKNIAWLVKIKESVIIIFLGGFVHFIV